MKRPLVTLALSLGLLLTLGQSAYAAAPVAYGEVQVQIWPGEIPGGAVVIASVVLTDTTPLPATVRIPVPEGLKVDWAGEISGVSPESDVSRPFTLKQGDGGQYAEFEVSTMREAQVDLSSLPLVIEGDTTRGSLDWVQATPASQALFSIRVPAGNELVSASPEVVGKPGTNAIGEKLYALETQTPEEGDEITVDFEYSAGAATPPAVDTGDAVVTGLFVALGLAAMVLVVVIMRRRSNLMREEEL